MSPISRFIHVRILPLLFILGGVITLYLGIHDIYLANTSTEWPQVEGVIQSSVVQENERQVRFHKRVTYSPQVFYQFTVAEQSRIGKKISFAKLGQGYPYAQDVVSRYPKGKVVKVYYRADNPDLNVLEPGLKGHQLWFISLVGLILLMGGIASAVWLNKAQKHDSNIFRMVF